MELAYKFGNIATALAMVLISFPQLALATQSAAGQTIVAGDVALGEGGQLTGQVLDANGIGRASVAVSIQRPGETSQQVTTDENGWFAFRGLTGGIYQLSVGDKTYVYRAWAPDTAPPVAKPFAMLVPDRTVVRGTWGESDSFLGNLIGCPLFWGALVAAGIIIPLSIDSGSSS
jgi:hypothetical protein